MLIVDAGPLYAAFARRDEHHTACATLLREASRPLLVPALALSEAAFLIGDRLGAEAELTLARSLHDGELVVANVDASEWPRIHELVTAYSDLPLGIVDASVVALAERLGAGTIATLDRKHFSVVRPRHVDAFELVP